MPPARVKPISARIHGILDYLSVAVLVLSGPLLRFEGRPAELTQTVAGSVLVYSAFTAYPPGFFHQVSLPIHRAIDIIVALAMIVSPWLLGFSDIAAARNFFVLFGAVSLIIVALTDFTEMPHSAGHRHPFT